VLPALQPLLEAGGSLSGMNDQLILRASRRNREQIKQALAAIDTPARRLLIRVSQNRDAQSRQQGSEVAGQIVIDQRGRITQPSSGTQGNTRIEVRRGASSITAQAHDRQGTESSGSTQMVQVVEGGRALIHVGQSLPIPLRQMAFGPRGAVVSEGIVYRDLGQGFYAAPRVIGDRVTLEISPQFDSPRQTGLRQYRNPATVNHRVGSPGRVARTGRQQPADQLRRARQSAQREQSGPATGAASGYRLRSCPEAGAIAATRQAVANGLAARVRSAP
jgi:type II secretory pathway component GspD/PulD (secretin)